MKSVSKLIMLIALGATALTSLAGTVSAQESYAVTKYEYNREGGETTNGLTFGLTGRYDSGFSYDLNLLSSDTTGVGTLGADVELGYRFGGIAGPVAVYETRNTGGVDAYQFLLGVEGGTSLAGFDVFGKALADVDTADTYRLSVGTGYALSQALTLSGELTHFANEVSPKMNLLEVGARYNLTGNLHADLGAHYGREHGGAEKTGVSVGLGFSF